MLKIISLDGNSKPLLTTISYFRNLDHRTLENVAAELVVRHYNAGEVIFLQGEANAGLHLVVEGICKLYQLSPQGREHALALLKAGDSCNEVPVVDHGPNPANLIALEDSTVWVLSSEAMSRLRHKYPELNDYIIENLAMRCRQMVERIYTLSFLSVTGRLAAFLLQQVETKNTLNRRQWTQDEIAAHLGTVREMVGRSFKELQQANLIAINRHQIEIIDREGLEALT